MSTTSAIDLSKLPPPQVVKQLAYEVIYQDVLATFVAAVPEFDATVESDPTVRGLQALAYREMLKRAEYNDDCKAVMLAFAEDGDLDQLVALYGVERLMLDPGNPDLGIGPTYESNDDLRYRTTLAPQGYSVAGPDGAYKFHALSASGLVLDAKPTSPSPGEVVVTVLSRIGSGAADADLLALVEAQLSADTVRPLTDHVTVQSAEIVEWSVIADLWTFAGPDPAVVIAQAQANLASYCDTSHRLGRDITLSGVYAALHVQGMQRVTLHSPAADLVIGDTQAPYCVSVTLNDQGVDE